MAALAAAAASFPVATAFFSNPPFFDHTHSTGWSKRSRAASKIYTGSANHAGGVAGGTDNTKNGKTTQQQKEGAPVLNTAVPIPPRKLEGHAHLLERVGLQVSEDDTAVLAELKGIIQQHMNPYRALFDRAAKIDPLNTDHIDHDGAVDVADDGEQIIGTDFMDGIVSLPNFGTGAFLPGAPRPEAVHIILFNPETKQEGMHSIEYPKGTGNNLILAFESKSDCDNFASHLTADPQFADPVTYEMELDAVESYCSAMGIFVQVVPSGTNVRPPTDTKPVMGHDPNLNALKQALDYVFDMADLNSVLDYGNESLDSLRGAGAWIDDDMDGYDGIAYFDDAKGGCWE